MSLEQRETLVLVPAWNEEASVGLVVRDLLDHGHAVLVISDGSTDQTAYVARASGAQVLELPINLGVGAALRAGFRYALARGFDRVVQCDADGQHPVGQIKTLLDAQSLSGAHLVIGSRFADGGDFETSQIRKLAMRILAVMARRITSYQLTDVSSGFRVISRDLYAEFVHEFPSAYLGDTFEAVISAGRGGYVIQEVPVVMKQRIHGKSTASTISAIKFLLRVILVVMLRIETRIQPLKAAELGTH